MNQPIRWHGGKHYLAKRIIELMPPRDGARPWHLYREPFAGGLSVLLQLNPEGLSEAVNDLDGDLSNFWRVIASEDCFARFKRMAEGTPFSSTEWESSEYVRKWIMLADPILLAVRFFIHCRQSRQGLRKDFATPTRRLRRGMNENVSAWLSAVEGLPEVHARLKRVEVQNMKAVDFIRQYDDPEAVFYCDPPYLHSTRTVTDAYRHEMGDTEHAELLVCLSKIKGRFLLSGYKSELYGEAAERYGWRRVDFEIDNKSGAGETKQLRTESVWMNY
jgi:DNA adenine methylase